MQNAIDISNNWFFFLSSSLDSEIGWYEEDGT